MTALHTEMALQGVRHVLVGLGAMLEQFENDPRLCTEIAGRLDAEVDGIGLFSVFRGDGALLCGDATMLSGPRDEHVRTSEFDPPSGEPAVLRMGSPADGRAVRLIEPVRANDRIAGFVTADVTSTWLNDAMGRYPLSPDTTIMLIDRTGEVVARRPDPDEWVGYRIPEEMIDGLRPRHPALIQEVTGLDSRPRIVASAPLPSFPDGPFVLAGLDRDAEIAAVNRASLGNAAIIGLIVIVTIATAVVGWETAGALVRHERKLSEAKAAAERIAQDQQRIADTIGHDLRNSVQTLVSFLRNLRRNAGRPPDAAMLPYVARAIGDLRSSLDILIRASRLEANAIEPRRRLVQLAPFLRKIANDWQFYAETKGLTLTVVAGSEAIETDPDLLRSIVANLVSNAIKHTETGGVTVSVDADGEDLTDIAVCDTGKGIPPAKADIIFEAFSRLEPEKTEGLGLGLSIAKRSADLIGCEVILDRQVVSGCRFIVRLRKQPGSAEANAAR